MGSETNESGDAGAGGVRVSTRGTGVLEPLSPAHVVSSVRVETDGWHDRVSVWNRGGKAGELVVTHGDGAIIGERLTSPWYTIDEVRDAASAALEKASREIDELATRLHDAVQDGSRIDEARDAIRDVIVSLADTGIACAVAARASRGTR